jgi:hypothetical protein
MDVRGILVALCFLILVTFCFRRGSVNALREGIDNFVEHFRGGPPTPMHPSPANDSRLVSQPGVHVGKGRQRQFTVRLFGPSFSSPPR